MTGVTNSNSALLHFLSFRYLFTSLSLFSSISWSMHACGHMTIMNRNRKSRKSTWKGPRKKCTKNTWKGHLIRVPFPQLPNISNQINYIMSTTGRVQLILHKSEDKISMLPIQVSNCTEQYRLLIKQKMLFKLAVIWLTWLRFYFRTSHQPWVQLGDTQLQ